MRDMPAETVNMWARDNAAHALGIDLLGVGDDSASLRLTIGPQHLNSHAICHGGVIFTLADCAFAYASNAGAEMAVAQANSITYLAPGKPGDVLTAHASLVSRAGRTAIYDVMVTTATGETIALLRAQARFVGPQNR
jgi:acyl-CoA thioesterase